MDKKRNTDTAMGVKYPYIKEFHHTNLNFIAIDNKDQVIIGLSKKIVATHVVGELEVLV